MKRKNYLLKFIFLYIINIMYLNAYVETKPNVLFLHSYHPSSSWTKEVNSGMSSIFNDTTKYNIYIEYMDTKRHRSIKHFNNLKNIYHEKYKNIKFDVIISSDDNAFNFLKEYSNKIFKNTPVVFCGVNNLQKEALIGFDNFTGITEENDIKKNYELILKLHPKTKTIYNLVDTTTTGKSVKKLIISAINESNYKNVSFKFIDNFTMSELIKKLQSLPKDSVLLHSAYFKTKDEQYIEYSDLQNLLNLYVSVPTYTSADKVIGLSVIGGYIVSGYSQGKTAAQMANRIINHTKVKNIPVLYNSPNIYIFDYNKIKKFKINEKSLPNDSIFINKKVSVYDLYFKEIVTTLTVFILMIIYIITLLININKRKKAELSTRKQLVFQQDLIDHVNTPIYYKNLKKQYIGCNKAFENIIQLPKEEILNKTAYDLVDIETAKYFHEQDDMLIHTKKVQEYETTVTLNKDKKNLKFYKNLFYENGEISGIVGAIFDITESKALNYELNRTFLTLDKNVIISKTDHEGKIFYASKAFLNISGYSEDELKGKKHTLLTSDLISQEIYDNLRETIFSKKIWSGELLNRSKDGDLFTLYTIITPEYDKNGDFINYTAISQDITAKKDIEQAKKDIEKLNKEISDTQKEVVFRMGAIAEARSKETGQHVKRVAEYSKLLAIYWGMDKEEAEILKQASPMHDIGKVAIPDSILGKKGELTFEEFEIMKTHTTIGYEMLKTSSRPILKTAAIVAYEHQEKYDGSGYPRALKGKEIHIYGRITALADVFDALGSNRCYKKAWEDESIFNLFKEERGKHFDPVLVDIFFENLNEFLKIRNEFKDK